MKNAIKIVGIIVIAAVIFAGCASLFGGGSVKLPRDMVGKWYATAEAAAAEDASQLRYEVMADGTVIHYGGEAPVTAQVTSFRKGEEVRSYTINDVEYKETIGFFSTMSRNSEAGTQTPVLHIMDAPRGNTVFNNGRSYQAPRSYTAPPPPAARPTYTEPPASDAGRLIASWQKLGGTTTTIIRFTADGRLFINASDSNAYRVSGNNIVLDDNTSNVLQYRIEGNELFLSSSNFALSVMLGGTYTRQ